MNYLLLFISVSVNTVYTSLHNYLGKKKMKSAYDNYVINACSYGIGMVILTALLFATWKGISLFTILFGLLFGLATALSGIFHIKALSCGPMSFTTLITTSSMILPAFSGALVWKEELSWFKVLGTFMMIAATYFIAAKDKKIASPKWLGYCMAAFSCIGAIGIMQKVQQKSAYAAESTPFLTMAFLSATLLCTIFAKCANQNTEGQKNQKFQAGMIFPAVLCGIFIVFLNVVNLYLSGVLPSTVLFPIQNGGTTLLNVLSAIVLFREKSNRRIRIGLAIGMVALVFLII